MFKNLTRLLANYFLGSAASLTLAMPALQPIPFHPAWVSRSVRVASGSRPARSTTPFSSKRQHDRTARQVEGGKLGGMMVSTA